MKKPSIPSNPAIRSAQLSDLDRLVALENQAFSDDRISRRQFRHMLTRANAAVLVAEEKGQLLGDLVVLFSRGTATARLYSIAVAEDARGRGIGRLLAEAAEAAAWERERPYLRLEVRKDNLASIGLFEAMGYRRFGEHADCYADHMDAWRYEKSLDTKLRPSLARVPFYRQTLDFTCGSACLMMGMKALNPKLKLDRMLELRLWREATTIFMTSGHGGCGPFGLALAAAQRGFETEVRLSAKRVHLIDSVRDPEKKEVMTMVQKDMERELRERAVPIDYGTLPLSELEARFEAGWLMLVLISSWQIYEEKSPHWVVLTGFDEHFVYVHDPYIDEEADEVPADSINMPIGREQFARMARYGRRGLQATVLLREAKR